MSGESAQQPSREWVTGCDAREMVRFPCGGHGHRRVEPAFTRLRREAAKVGIDLRIASGFRDFQRQRTIWNAKVDGELPVMDAWGHHPLSLSVLSPWEQTQAILRWSALPGASRHHWGTDFDVYDAAAVGDDYRLQLSPEEYTNSGPFAYLNDWLNERMAQGACFGFYRPYAFDRGGVAQEPWHISYWPVAKRCALAWDEQWLRELLVHERVLLADCILEHFDRIRQRFLVL